MKRYIWGFPGVGKSNLNVPGLTVVDADCRLFEFKNVIAENLHANSGVSYVRDESYPDNYLKYINEVTADVVLINCHIGLLDCLNKDDVLIVYPSKELLGEYFERYSSRGDNNSFVSYMASEAPGMIDYIESTDFEKYKVQTSNTYLSDLFERNDFKLKIMTRSELTAQLQRAIDLNVLETSVANDEIICDLSFINNPIPSAKVYSASALADAVLDGKYDLDIDQLQKVCSQREAEIEKEKLFMERRGGLTREELEDKIMQGIVNGALGIRYSEISPYSHGYEVTFGGGGEVGSTWKFKNRWECYCDLFEIPGKIAGMIENEKQSGRVFGDKAQSLDIKEMLAAIDEMEGKQISSFVPAKESGFERRGRYTGHVASVTDVHKGLALDGIVQHYYHGDYSSMTPCRQNELVEALVCLKGFCLDCINNLDVGRGEKEKIVEYLKKHGMDVSTPEKLREWIKANPAKCGKEENRKLSLDAQICEANKVVTPAADKRVDIDNIDKER